MPTTPDNWTRRRKVRGLSQDDLYELIEWCRRHNVKTAECNGVDAITCEVPLHLIEGFDLCYAREMVRD
jgi:hypothetical protein